MKKTDMEEKVAAVIKLIEEDGDSFAKRAEMYYKKRPELIHFVEESYRAYRALAERYDHISKELQNANTTIASCFPEQIQFMDDEDEYSTSRFPKKFSEKSKGNIPQVPKLPAKDLKGLITSATKKMQNKKSTKATANAVPKSGLTKAEGLKEIDKLQKRILALQTEKEFVKSSYECGVTKYWEIDNEIKEMQVKVCSLKDEFGEGRVIEDDEARNVMAATALKSCKETLDQLQEKQEKSIMQAEVEQKRIEDARERLDSLKNQFLSNEVIQEKPYAGDESGIALQKSERLEQNVCDTTQKRKDMESLREKIKEHFEAGLGEALTVTDMAEKIDELVNKVINLETSVSSQTALIQRLRTETDELQAQIQTLEADKATLIDGKNDLRNKLREMEDKLLGIQDLKQSIEDQNNNLQTHFTEAHCNFDHLSEKMHSANPDVELARSSKEKKIKDSDKKQEAEKLGKEFKVADPSGGCKHLQSANPQEMVAVSASLKKEEDAQVKVELQKETEEKGEKSDHNAGYTKEGDVKLEGREDAKGHDSVSTSSNEGGVSHETSKPAEKYEGREDEKGHGSVAASTNEVGVSHETSKPADKHERREDAKGGNSVSASANEEGVSHETSKPSEKYGGREDAKGHGSISTATNEGGVSHETSMPSEKHEGREDAKGHDFVSTSTHEGGVSHGTSKPSEKYEDLKTEENFDEQASSQTANTLAKVKSQEHERGKDDEPDWKKLFLKGMDDREKNLVAEYTKMLRNYKDAKKKLMEVETNNQNGLFEITLQLKELKSSNAMKDEEIQSLRKKLSLFEKRISENNNIDQSVEPRASSTETSTTSPPKKEADEDIAVMLIDQSQTSEIEEKFRMHIDELLEENLDFWFRFSSAFHEVQKFETEVKDLVAEASKLEERQTQEGSSTTKYSLKSDVRPLYKHLREVQNELSMWVEKSVMLKKELKSRFSSLCEIQEEITKALKASAEDDDFKFTSYQAAKFQGEILNMKQENNKVADELQAGLDIVTTLQLETERTVAKLTEDWGLSGSKNRQSSEMQDSGNRSGVPLRSFIFGVKAKKQKTSIFSCVHPALQRKYNGLRSGISSNR
ncbi:hypothetical protein DITRI_Ditri16bG0056600 [Diplodiscus trichospermus]